MLMIHVISNTALPEGEPFIFYHTRKYSKGCKTRSSAFIRACKRVLSLLKPKVGLKPKGLRRETLVKEFKVVGATAKDPRICGPERHQERGRVGGGWAGAAWHEDADLGRRYMQNF